MYTACVPLCYWRILTLMGLTLRERNLNWPIDHLALLYKYKVSVWLMYLDTRSWSRITGHYISNTLQFQSLPWPSVVQFDHSWVRALIIDVESPINFWLIVEAYHKVGHQLEEVLPQAQEEVQVEVTDVNLAVYSWVIHITHALKTVDIVDAEASVHTWVRDTFIHILLTPAGKQHTSGYGTKMTKCTI